MWRWDQGRLEYFRFDEIRRIARALSEFDGNELPRGDEGDTLREVLARHSDLPFHPTSYTVWRNYGRVFGAQLLAAKYDRILVCTELCKMLSAQEVSADEYMLHVFNRFYYPAPFFAGYDPAATKIFPFAALVKLLIAKAYRGNSSGISLDEAITMLIGNELTGQEAIATYASLKKSGLERTGLSIAEQRQVRELMIFASQISFLKWRDNALFLDVDAGSIGQIERLIQPFWFPAEGNPVVDLLNLGTQFNAGEGVALLPLDTIESATLEFAEGSKVRVTHLRYERSSKLRDMYFSEREHPEVCEICALNTDEKYPWTNKLIEVHHLLPLSSPIRIDLGGTSLADVVGLCPSCHRATHRFYGLWLKREGIRDFRSYAEARDAFEATRNAVAA